MQHPEPKIIVIGTSAGGIQALEQVLSTVPEDVSAAFFIVQHMSVDSSADFLADRLSRNTKLPCKVARNGATIKSGQAYLAPPDQHLLLKQHHVLVAKGPRENQFRPSIDPLFRSAAAYHGNRVVGVVLTGLMTDGVVGAEAVQRAGGVVVAQDPDEAEYPGLPQSVIRTVGADYVVPVADLGPLLNELAHAPDSASAKVPPDILLEAEIAERVMTNPAMTNIDGLNKLGDQVPLSCPECGGALWDVSKGRLQRYRCQAGHAYTDETLLHGMNHALEETLWVALRILEERRTMFQNMAEQERGRGMYRWAHNQQERAEEMKVHIQRIRDILLPREAAPGLRDNGQGEKNQQAG